MSQNLTNQDYAQASNAAPGNEASIVDRTQQLIDEVNQLLGAGTGVTPAPAASAPAPVAPSLPAVPTPLAEEPAASVAQTEIAAPPAPVEMPAVEALAAEAIEALTPQVPTQESTPTSEAIQAPVAAETPVVTETPVATENSSDSADLSSFLDGLMSDTPSEPAPPVAVTPDVEVSAVAAETEAAFAATTPVVVESTADPIVAPVAEPASEPVAETQGGFDIDALKSVFESGSTEEPAAPSEPVAATSVLETPPQATEAETAIVESLEAIANEAPAAEPSISSETSALLDELNSLVDAPTESASTESVDAAEAATTAPVETAEAPTVTEEPTVEATQEPAAEESAEDDNRSFTEKYLEQFRSSFDEDAPSAANDSAAVASEAVAATPNPEPEPEEPSSSDSAEMSVEDWLARNIGNSSDSDEAEESEEASADETPATAETPVPGARPVEPTLTFGEMEEEPETEPAHDFASLEASYARKLRNLEKRIGGMFETLSTKLEGGVAMKSNEVDDTPVDSMTAGEVENLKVELQEKLRKAEVELSINRAKISQQKVQMEQMQADLERREADLERKLERQKSDTGGGEGDDGEKKNGGLMDRWKRHLG